jgi:sensor histidine kinase YesM
MTKASIGTNHKKYWLFQLAFWGGYWLLNLIFVTAWGYSSTLMNSIFFFLSLLMFVFSHSLRFIYKSFFYEKTLLHISLHLLWLLPLASVLIQFILFGIIYLIVQMDPVSSQGLQTASLGSFIGYSINTCIMLVLWCLVYLFRAEWVKRRKTEMDYWQNQIKLRDIELQFLRSQINSHFLFNALNNIRSLILEDVQAARQGLNDLATLLRGVMHSEAKITVSLREEVEWVKGYLALESLQFEQRLSYELAIDPALLDAQLPPLLLQTLVENAIKHGISRRRFGGSIRISANPISSSHWRLQVENPTAELPAEHESNGIGLKNARDRLFAAFGNNARLELHFSGTVIATAEMPL